MNLEFVKQVGRDNPSWLPTNLGRTCFAHTKELIRRLRAAGHEAWFVCKREGEGGYRPDGFTPRMVTGLDGKPYLCSLLSHDVIFYRERGSGVTRQFDTLFSANEHDRPIYRIPGSDNVSFDPTSGPHIEAAPAWSEVTAEKWRSWNPPFDEEDVAPPAPVPVPTPAPIAGPGREEMMQAGEWLDEFYRSEAGLQRVEGLTKNRRPDWEGIGAWLFDVYWNARLHGNSVEQARAAVVAAIQDTDEWRGKHR